MTCRIKATNQSSSIQVWGIAQIGLASALGGPLAGFLLLSQNSVAFGQFSIAKRMRIWGFIATPIFILLLICLPVELMESFPRSVIPAIYTCLFVEYARKAQKGSIEEALNSGGKRKSYWRLFEWICISLMLTILTVGALIFTLSLFSIWLFL